MTVSSIDDYPALRQLGRALWRGDGGRGAAVLVGAGLSRCADLASPITPPPPLWQDLAGAMKAELYAGDEGSAPHDPLRLAEEYRQYFGQAALDAFVRRYIADETWFPSETHRRLLDLPWSDVLTTNYDTLLERAARSSPIHYQTVLREDDLGQARAPRIAKLHGSIGATDRFVIAEEDFRTYPARHAAFVNLARQVFVENELVLVGFSGDDPNFLAWAGWVRDQLGSSARRIYLAGALRLGPARRKFLEARNIAPIDLAQLVRPSAAMTEHQSALDLLLEHLHEIRPVPAHEWRPDPLVGLNHGMREGPAANADRLKNILPIWRRERLAYPGWLVCPADVRKRMRLSVDGAPFGPSVLAQLVDQDRAAAVLEICWRHRTGLWPMHPSKFADIRREIDDGRLSALSPFERLTVLRTMAWQAQQAEDTPSFVKFETDIRTESGADADAVAELEYMIAVRACRETDYPAAVDAARRIVGSDPFGKARMGAILAEAGLIEEADEMVTAAVGGLRALLAADRSSIWIRSRLAWAELSAKAHSQNRMVSEEWSGDYRPIKADPFTEMTALRDDIIEKRRAAKPIRAPAFAAGSFVDSSRTVHFGSSSNVEPFVELDLLLTDAAVPPRIGIVAMFLDDRRDALALAARIGDSFPDWLRIADDGEPAIDAVLSRVVVAGLPIDLVTLLAERLRVAIDYWSKRAASGDASVRFCADRRRILLRVFARLAVRYSSEQASVACRWATTALASGSVAGAGEEWMGLLSNIWSAMPTEMRAAFAPDLLALPFQSDPGVADPCTLLFDVDAAAAVADPRRTTWVANWIDAARGGHRHRSAALARLLHLRRAGGLDAAEEGRFLAALWSSVDVGTPPLPSETSFYDWVWTEIPRPDGVDQALAVCIRLIDVTGTRMTDGQLQSLRSGVDSGRVSPDAARAAAMFDVLAAEDPPGIDATDPGAMLAAAFSGYDQRYRRRLVSLTLAAVGGRLDEADLNRDRADALIAFVHRTGALAAASVLARFPFEGAIDFATTTVRRGLRSSDDEDVADAVDGLIRWRRGWMAGDGAAFAALVETVISGVEFRRTAPVRHLLGASADLVHSGMTSATQDARLSAALGDFASEWDYARISPGSEEAGVVSIVRSSCVHLAMTLEAKQPGDANVEAWRRMAIADPLPEVRDALGDTDQ